MLYLVRVATPGALMAWPASFVAAVILGFPDPSVYGRPQRTPQRPRRRSR